MIHFALRVFYFVELVLFYVKEVLVANIEVAAIVISRGRYIEPGIVAVPLDLKKAGSMNALANMITMTPGTMSLEVDADKRILYVYKLHNENSKELKETIKDKYEKRVMRTFE